jgi:hypothetical protein
MTPIKITEANAAAIEAALKNANGRAEAHAYTAFAEIEALAETAESKLESLGLPKAQRAGAVWVETSGGAVANAYAKKGFSRSATSARLERRASGWYLVSAAAATIYASGGGNGLLILTAKQDAEAVRRLRAGYSAIKAAS